METPRSNSAKRCTAELEVEIFGYGETLRCSKDDGHSEYVWSQEHPDGASCPTDHRYIIEIEQEHPHA